MADRYWVGGTATWDGTAGTKWSTSSGGASGASAPTTADNVFFDAASSGTVTIGATSVAANIDCTGFTGTWSHGAATATCAGTVFKLVAGMTYVPATNARAWQFTSTTGTCQITTAGKTMGNLTFNGAGGTFQLQDNLTATLASTRLTLTAGTFDANGFNVTVDGFASSNSNTRTITMGSGLWTLTGVATIWTTATVTGLTFNKNTANISVTTTTNAAVTLSFGGLACNGITIAAVNGVQAVSFTTSARFTSLAITAPRQVIITLGTTLTVDNAFTLNGSSGNYLVFYTSSLGSTATISVPSGTATMSYAALRDIVFSGGATFTASNSFDLKGNSGITITGPSSSGRVQLVNSEALVA